MILINEVTEQQKQNVLLLENEILDRLICSRNALINNLLELPSLSETDFSKGLDMRQRNSEADKITYAEVLSKGKLSMRDFMDLMAILKGGR